MIFHIIDLRGVDEWLECVECRCRNDEGTYLNTGSGDGQTGGVSCCTNCTSTLDPLETVDYRMRYNISYSEVREDAPVTAVQQITTDASPAVGKSIEYDVPSFQYLPEDQRKDGYIQRLERTGRFRDLFQMDFFGDAYAGPDTVRLLRCVGHLHIAAIGMWLEDAETGEVICSGVGTHGTDPETNKVSWESFLPGARFVQNGSPLCPTRASSSPCTSTTTSPSPWCSTPTGRSPL